MRQKFDAQRPVRFAAAGVLWLTIIGQTLPALARPIASIVRVSVASNGAQANGRSTTFPVISANGRFIAFVSEASNLVPNDTNAVADVFVYDRIRRTTSRVSVASDGTQGNLRSGDRLSISTDGRYIAFNSEATNLVTGDTNRVSDIFVHDRRTGRTERVSVTSNGAQANGMSDYVSISGNGRYLTFSSFATNLLPTQRASTSPVSHVYFRDRRTGQTILVDRAPNGAVANSSSIEPVISSNGQVIAYSSSASNLVAGDTNRVNDVFTFDRLRRRTTRVSLSSLGEQGNEVSLLASISANGRFVAFSSGASNLVPNDTNGPPLNPNNPTTFNDIFIRDRLAQQTTRVTLSSVGVQTDGSSGGRFVNSNGRHVGFWSRATNLVPGDTNGFSDIFVRDRFTNTTDRISVSVTGVQGNNASGGGGTQVSMSANGRYVVFWSLASNLVPGDTNRVGDIFLVDRGPAFSR